MPTPINEQTWHQMSEEVMTGMREWRMQHPKATLRAMEEELDTRLNQMRARMLEDMALASAVTDWVEAPPDQQPCCRACHTPLQQRGDQSRTLQTSGGQQLTLARQYGTCPTCGVGLFPPR